MEMERTPVGWGSWLAWTVTSAIGLAIGLLVLPPARGRARRRA